VFFSNCITSSGLGKSVKALAAFAVADATANLNDSLKLPV